MEKRAPILFLLFTAVLALSCLGVYALAAPGRKGETAMPETTILVASDLHYIAPELTDHGAYFEDMIMSADGKVTEYVEELTEAFIAEVIERAPAALVLSGDITFNGALESHQALADRLRAVVDAGIPVLVIPGNHDLENRNAARFHGDSFTRIASASPEDFASIWADFGYAGARARDRVSLSYVYEVSPALRVLMLDVNMPDSPNTVRPETLAWIEAELQDAAMAGAKVIAVSHQNVYRHNPVIYKNYVIENADEVLALYEKYGVLLNFSGHLHCQHIVRDEAGFCEIATSSLAVSPCQYGILRVTDHTLAYETSPVDVSAWAAEAGLTDPNLLDFAAYADGFFRGSDRSADRAARQDPSSEAGSLRQFFGELNALYFAGRLDLLDPEDPMFARWEETFGFEGQYILAIREEAGLDSTHLTLTY